MIAAASSYLPSASYRRHQDVAGFLEAGNDLARLERLAERIVRTAGEVMDPGDAHVDEE